jgi:small-conductance mechanosensitive channel
VRPRQHAPNPGPATVRVYTWPRRHRSPTLDVVSFARSHYHHVTVDILNRLLPSSWWTDPGTTIEGPLVLAFAIALAVVFVLSVALWLIAPRLAPDNRLHQRLIARLAKWVLALAAIGLLLLLFRWQIVPFFSKRLWLYLWVVAVVAGVGYVFSYWRTIYPERLAAWEDAERRRRYLPKPGQGAGRSRRRSRRRR